jgi:type IV pilus assembly protein PilC
MATFMYEALDSQGNPVKAEVDAVSEREANDKIRALNYYPTQVTEKPRDSGAAPTPVARKRGGLSFSFSVSQKSLTEATRQFATLLDAGLPIVRSLDILWAQQSPGLLKETLADVKSDVEGGSALSEALAKHPRVFDRLYVNMVKAGEAGGVLDQILSRLSDYMEKSLRLKQKIIGALVYPAAVITIAGGILTFILVFIIPKFEQMFKEMDMGGMPWLTELLMNISRMFACYWYVILFVGLLLWAAVHFVGKTPKGRYTIDLMKLKLPVFGRIISKSAISRFCRTLGTLIQSGVPILNALSIIRNATGNAVVAGAIESVHNSIREGDTISEPLRRSGVFDDLVVNMIQVGEETGELDRMLIKVADTYDGEVDTLVGAMMSLLEPILIIGMGGAVGFIVIALFMPLIHLMSNMNGGR